MDYRLAGPLRTKAEAKTVDQNSYQKRLLRGGVANAVARMVAA